jgi:hypothetical protein
MRADPASVEHQRADPSEHIEVAGQLSVVTTQPHFHVGTVLVARPIS